MLYIRADMNEHIATGHVMRCLSIADAAKKIGVKVLFVFADSNPVELIESRGHKCCVLNTKWDDMESEITAFATLCAKEKMDDSDVILVDSYYVTSQYFNALKRFDAKVWYIDDMHSEDWPVDGIICYSNFYDEIGYGPKYKIKGLWGPRYAPIRKEFAECGKKQISEEVKNLLILSGGADPYDVIGNVLSRIDIDSYDCINAVCGIYNERYGALVNKYKDFRQVHIVKAVTNLIEYMKQADVAISASGSTLFELCAVGTPTICYTLADNQIKSGERFGKDGVMIYAGDVRDEGVCVVSGLSQIIGDYRVRSKMSSKMQSLIDGYGVERIIKSIMNNN